MSTVNYVSGAKLGRRLGAYLLDSVIVTVAYALISPLYHRKRGNL